MIDQEKLGALFGGLRAILTVADEDGHIIYMNDLAIDHYADRGGEALIGTSLHKCHSLSSQDKIEQMYTRHRAGDLIPTRYHEEKGDGLGESIVVFPLVVAGQFRGIAELLWTERQELVFEG
jgi:hypothetical protein